MQTAGAERKHVGGGGSNTPPRVINFEKDPIRRAVMDYLRCDYSVIPIKRGTKEPYVFWKEFQTRKPSEAEWDSWLKAFPEAQIAVVTGEISKLMVIDFDKEKAIDAFKQKFGPLPETIRQKTGKGIHYFYFCPPGVPSKVGIMDGVDIRAERGYVMMTPSMHPTGKRYRFQEPFEDIYFPKLPNPPAAFIEYLKTPPPQTQKRDPVTLAPVPIGQRNATLTRIAGRLISKGLSQEEVLFVSQAWNEKLQESLSPSEVEATVKSIWKTDLRNHPSRASAQIEYKGYTGLELLKTEFPAPRWAVPGILPEGLNILAGKPKCGKSMLALNICLAVVLGGKALGQVDVQKGAALNLALEDTPRRFKDRLERMLREDERSPAELENLHFHNKWAKMGSGGLEKLEERITQIDDLRLVVIDTLIGFRPFRKGNQNQYSIDYEDIAAIKELSDRHQVPFLLIHHLRKAPGEDPIEEISGSYGISGAADGLLVMKGKGQFTELHMTGRDIERATKALKFNSDLFLWSLEGDADAVQSTGNQQAIYDVLKNSPDPMSPKEIFEATSLKLGYIYKALGILTSSGKIQKKDRGRYTIG
jgi:hypothetical protein